MSITNSRGLLKLMSIEINKLIKHSYTYTNGLAFDWKPIKGLTLRSEATISLSWRDNNRFWGD